MDFAFLCKVLGVRFDLRQSGSGLCLVTNTEERISELCDLIDTIVQQGRLRRSDGERLRGRLQFASGQLFGRTFKGFLNDLNKHLSSGRAKLSDRSLKSLSGIRDLLRTGLPRRVDTNFDDYVHIYVDASFEPEGYSGLGGLLLSSNGKCLGHFSEEVPRSCIDSFIRSDQNTVIFELEALALVASLDTFHDLVAGHRVIIFTDNEGVRSIVLRSSSKNPVGAELLDCLGSLEDKLQSRVWVERVPSESNPADRLSREVVEVHDNHDRRRCLISHGSLREALRCLRDLPSGFPG